MADDSPFFDRDLGLRIRGLTPGAKVALAVTATDVKGQLWQSRNLFVASEAGEVDPSRQEPESGTYSGRHPMGPFWSMTGAEKFHTASHAELRIQVLAGERPLAERTLTWLSPRGHPSIVRSEIRNANLVADLYLPQAAAGPLPAVLVLGGSGGCFNAERAALLASHGFAALDVAYHGVQGTPEYHVESIPLEYFMGAVSRLEQDPRIDASRIAVMGKSYGAQLALLLASHESRIRAVIAEAPSSFVTATSASYPEGPAASAWSLNGEPFFFLGPADDEDEPAPKEIRVATSGEVAIESHPAARRAAIPAERINGPILLISGQDDRLWGSTAMAEQVVERLLAHGFQHPVQHLGYPDAGHNLAGGQQAYGVPNLPPKDRGDSRGGSRQGNSVAGIAAWQEALAFLRRHFGDSGPAE